MQSTTQSNKPPPPHRGRPASASRPPPGRPKRTDDAEAPGVAPSSHEVGRSALHLGDLPVDDLGRRRALGQPPLALVFAIPGTPLLLDVDD